MQKYHNGLLYEVILGNKDYYILKKMNVSNEVYSRFSEVVLFWIIWWFYLSVCLLFFYQQRQIVEPIFELIKHLQFVKNKIIYIYYLRRNILNVQFRWKHYI